MTLLLAVLTMSVQTAKAQSLYAYNGQHKDVLKAIRKMEPAWKKLQG